MNLSPDSVLPELRATWWETGLKARADAGVIGAVTELPGLVGEALRTAWRADRVRTTVIALAALGGGVMATFGLLATQRILVQLFAAGPTPQRVTAALPALAVLALAIAVRAAMGIAIGYATNGLTPRVNREVERRLFEVTTAVRLEAFDTDAFADDMERASRGSEAANDLVQDAINMFAGLVGVVAVAVAIVVIHPLLLIALLIAALPKAWASLAAGHEQFRTYLAGSVRRRRLWVLQRLMAERESALELRSYSLRRFLFHQFDQVMGAETTIQLGLARRVTTITSIGAAVSGLATGGVYVLLAFLLVQGRIPLAAAATCVIAIQAAQRALTAITLQIDRIYANGQFFHGYTSFMSRTAPYLPEPGAGCGAPPTLQELTVRKLSLWYPGRTAPAVNNVNLTIHAGQTVAFVGENGSGKTTLAALIAALRTPTDGTVEWNGVPLQDWDDEALRSRIAVVTQEYHKWPLTAATNIAIGDAASDPTPERIEAAATLAVANDMIKALPYGYDTLLDRTFAQGQDLSGGQWQRITAARGFFRDAELLIMDEPSSALDPRAENALFQAIQDRQGHKTTILITHRLANVRHADRIFVLREGSLVEFGSHEDLMAAGGHYAELFHLQAAGYHKWS